MITIEEKFNCVLVVENNLIPNSFDVKIELLPDDSTQKNYNIALERVHAILGQVMDDSILLGPTSVSKFSKPLGLNGIVNTFPDDPYDQMIAICLYTKLSAILRGVFFVDRVSVTSVQGQNVTHTFDCENDNKDILRSIIDDPDLEEYVDYWHNPNLHYFELNPNGMKLKENKWSEFNLEFVSESSKITSIKKGFKPRLVADNDKDPDET